MNIALFGRHPSPAEHIVFPEGIPEDKMDDYSWMMTQCAEWLDKKREWVSGWNGKCVANLYVEGFTPALIAFLNAWEKSRALLSFSYLRLMHHQPDGTYRPQRWNPLS
jgi:hypothetical protein